MPFLRNGFRVESSTGELLVHVFRRAPQSMMNCIYARLRYLLGNNWESVNTLEDVSFAYPSIHFVFYLRFSPDVSLSVQWHMNARLILSRYQRARGKKTRICRGVSMFAHPMSSSHSRVFTLNSSEPFARCSTGSLPE